ncbi:MAG: isoleucine--tRNA ligase, partial [Planctomycetaceae bacterium]|nr:isoleucine--tRNA ligase [Planctomycetaceae bacterium]
MAQPSQQHPPASSNTMTDSKTEQRSYKKTLNLPKTSFAMKANLVQREPEFQKRWAHIDLYQRLRTAQHPAGPFVFHDGPPYANGAIHLGHLLNKVLKDLVVRTRTMAGFDVPYVPGWDCHGLPIEHKVMRDLGDKAKDMNAMQIRRRCHTDAEKFVKLQAKQMQRLGTLADYDNPYLTMDSSYEAATLEVFADLVAKGFVHRALKPVHWSIANRTALADAELEYEDRQDTSIYVDFEAADPAAVYDAFALAGDDRPDQTPCFMIWTTTPWTLPANLAIAVQSHFDYDLVRLDGNITIVASRLVDHIVDLVDGAKLQRLATTTGDKLLGLTYRHPFIDRTSPVVDADYVTLEDGTGLVHTAPGHGADDFNTGHRCGLDIYCPVKDDGTFDDTAPDWLTGLDVWTANDKVVDHLRESGHLYHAHTFTHSYPHDWRSKTPTIFRATEQWFVAVDQPAGDTNQTLRDRALHVTADDVNFVPQWGRNRMRGMLESRPDWCISRQRAWGLPIPAFFNEAGAPLLTGASVRAIADQLRAYGSDHWFTTEPRDLLADYEPAADPDAPDWAASVLADAAAPLTKCLDIFDVWFESGSSWNAVMRQRGLARPDDAPAHSDLYLEGSDQHRGWFQLSLLPSLGVTGKSPFATVLTHGFMVDKDGRKMSKSSGNALQVEDLLKEFGADVCRWWVATLNTDNDIKVDHDFFALAGEEYRKVRNTIRFLLSNLSDFDPDTDPYNFTDADAASVDAWALGALNDLITTVTSAYDAYQYRQATEALFNFCNDTLSATYLAAVKDRLYCDKPDSPRRRRTQTAMHHVADALIRLIAPVLVHTADEAWLSLNATDLKDQSTCVHEQTFPASIDVPVHNAWPAVVAAR